MPRCRQSNHSIVSPAHRTRRRCRRLVAAAVLLAFGRHQMIRDNAPLVDNENGLISRRIFGVGSRGQGRLGGNSTRSETSRAMAQ